MGLHPSWGLEYSKEERGRIWDSVQGGRWGNGTEGVEEVHGHMGLPGIPMSHIAPVSAVSLFMV